MRAIRKAILSLGITVFGLFIAFAIMAKDMPHVYPGLSEAWSFAREKVHPPPRLDDLTALQHLRERSEALPEAPQGPGAPIGGGPTYGILDVFRMKQIFRPNDGPTQTHRTRPGQKTGTPSLPTIGETRKSNNSLSGTL